MRHADVAMTSVTPMLPRKQLASSFHAAVMISSDTSDSVLLLTVCTTAAVAAAAAVAVVDITCTAVGSTCSSGFRRRA
jgi:hypothetical protein